MENRCYFPKKNSLSMTRIARRFSQVSSSRRFKPPTPHPTEIDDPFLLLEVGKYKILPLCRADNTLSTSTAHAPSGLTDLMSALGN